MSNRNITLVIFMEKIAHTFNLLLLEDKSTTSVVDFFKNENNVKVRLFDNLDDVLDALYLCSNCPKSLMHFSLLFNLNEVTDEIIDFIKIVKSDSALKTTPISILSESTNNKDVRELYKSHLNNYIMKPEDLDDLNRVLDSFLKFWFDLVEVP